MKRTSNRGNMRSGGIFQGWGYKIEVGWGTLLLKGYLINEGGRGGGILQRDLQLMRGREF